jgi:hypothetical protein
MESRANTDQDLFTQDTSSTKESLTAFFRREWEEGKSEKKKMGSSANN